MGRVELRSSFYCLNQSGLQKKVDKYPGFLLKTGIWKEMSRKRRKAGGWIGKTEDRGPNGRGLCRWCGIEVPKGRRTFCGDKCVHEWRLRTDPGFLREQVLNRDRGICAICGLDTTEFYSRFMTLPRSRRKRLAPKLGILPGRKSFWDADHILPVAEGGGECSLSNIRTLCLWCHQEETARLRKRLVRKSSSEGSSRIRQAKLRPGIGKDLH